jgi:Zinc finger, C3HC4 type (RING finger)
METGVGEGLEPVPDIAQDNAVPTAAAAMESTTTGVIEPSGNESSCAEGDAEGHGSDEESGGESNGDDSAMTYPSWLWLDENEANGAVTVPDPAAAASAILADIAQLCYCSVCLGLMVKAQAIVPCGHVMCRACSWRVGQCPECRGPIRSAIPCRLWDSATRLLVSKEDIEIVPLSDIEEFRAKEKEEDSNNRIIVRVFDRVRSLGGLLLL